ncbi:hypothetical protein NVP1182O_07 [Vibrio phage 1.182.O._10N.286.46.E1]|nr:hypothetical protein NVP1182O_07 [Vibrio phage 1.182.O._10N.286.46.E1]
MRMIERLNWKMLASRLNGAYKRMLNDGDHKLIVRDIVGFAKLGMYEPAIEYTPEQLIELRGRQQMALHILRHLDIDATAQIEYQNDAQAQGNYINEDNQNG